MGSGSSKLDKKKKQEASAHLHVYVVQGKDIKSMDIGSESDPYVKIIVGDKKQKTKYRRTTKTPVWNAQFEYEFDSNNLPDSIKFECYDFDRVIRDDKIGEAQVDLRPLWAAAHTAVCLASQSQDAAESDEKINEASSNKMMTWLTLTKRAGVPPENDEVLGSIQVGVRCSIDSVLSSAPVQAHSPSHLLVVDLPQAPTAQIKMADVIPPKSDPQLSVAWGNEKILAPLFDRKARSCAFWVHATQSEFHLQFGVTVKDKLITTGAIPAQALLPNAASTSTTESPEEAQPDAADEAESPVPTEETKQIDVPSALSWVALTTGDLIDKDRNLQDLTKSSLYFPNVNEEPSADVLKAALKDSAFANESVIVMLPLNIRCYTIDEARDKLATALLDNYDVDNSGCISMSEFREALKGLTGHDVNPKVAEEVFNAVLATRHTPAPVPTVAAAVEATPESQGNPTPAAVPADIPAATPATTSTVTPAVNEPTVVDAAQPEAALTHAELSRVLDMVSFFSPSFGSKLLLGMKRAILGKDTFMDGVSYENEDPLSRTSIRIIDRKTGVIVEENIPGYISASLRVMFANRVSRTLSSNALSEALMTKLSKKQGEKFNKPESASGIEDFIELHRLNRDEIELDISEYPNFNEFFARRLKSWARPISDPENPSIAVSAADCRLTVFPTIDLATKLWIKGDEFTVEGVLQNEAEAKRYQGGSLAIFRLAPQDYHRWHLPVGGQLREDRLIPGALYTVNPLAINKNVNVYTKNKRHVFYIDSPEFGTVALVAVGATCVGSIKITSPPGTYAKGQEHGYFAFGGSTVLAFFEPNKITFDQDLWDNTSKGIETLVQCNSRIGVATGSLAPRSSLATLGEEVKALEAVEAKTVEPVEAKTVEPVEDNTAQPVQDQTAESVVDAPTASPTVIDVDTIDVQASAAPITTDLAATTEAATSVDAPATDSPAATSSE